MEHNKDGMTLKDFEDMIGMLRKNRPRLNSEPMGHFGIWFCKLFVKNHGATLFLMSVEEGNIIPMGEYAEQYK